MSDARFLGLDFGTESVRAVLVDRSGRTAATAVAPFAHGQIVRSSPAAADLFPQGIPPAFALQHPADWVGAAAEAVRLALDRSALPPHRVAGIGVDFTACTPLPCRSDGTPLCLTDHPARRCDAPADPLASSPHAWPKLWKHHGAIDQTRRINDLARARREPWLDRYGGVVGVEWLIPKILEVLDADPHVAAHADLWIEAGDWFVWTLTGCRGAPPRSTCQAGYKACWDARTGFPSADFLRALHPDLPDHVHTRCRGDFTPPGRPVGTLAEPMAGRMGLPTGIPVAAAIIDAHAGVPGAGVADPSTLVMVMGTSGCHMLLSEHPRPVPGVAGIVPDGILPGLVGYETGQAAMGDAFDLVRRLTRHDDFSALDSDAGSIPPGCDGLLCLDWFNGCRTPLMDASLSGAFVGLTLEHSPAHLYRAALEASAMGLRWIVETLVSAGVPVDRFVATGGLPHRNPTFLAIVAAALDAPVAVHRAEHGPALGAAVLGALAAGSDGGGFDDPQHAVRSMAGADCALPPPTLVQPDPDWARAYRRVYEQYRALADAAVRHLPRPERHP